MRATLTHQVVFEENRSVFLPSALSCSRPHLEIKHPKGSFTRLLLQKEQLSPQSRLLYFHLFNSAPSSLHEHMVHFFRLAMTTFVALILTLTCGLTKLLIDQSNEVSNIERGDLRFRPQRLTVEAARAFPTLAGQDPGLVQLVQATPESLRQR